MRARPVDNLDPDGAIADNAAAIVRIRVAELCDFMPRAADPAEVVALHDMRIAAKRLRYILEVTGECFGPYARTATKHVKALQEVLGEIHDADEQAPAAARFARELLDADVAVLAAAGDIDPARVRDAPHVRDHAGLAALQIYLRARRRILFERFLEDWNTLERKGFRARLEYALGERNAGS